MKRTLVATIVTFVMTAAAGTAAAQGSGSTGMKSSSHPALTKMFVLAPHAGVTYPAFSDLGFWGKFGAEIGFQPPIDGMPLEIAAIGRYTQPTADGSGTDPNLGSGGANYSWDLTQQMLDIDLVGMWRFRNIAGKLDPYALAGPRMSLMKTTMTAQGNGGNSFGEVQETNMEFGFAVGGGVDYRLGPGTLFGELRFGWTNLNQHLTGNSNTGSFVLDVGYRFYVL